MAQSIFLDEASLSQKHGEKQGHPYQLLHHEADKNGVRYLPYFFVTVLFHIRAAKIMLFYRILLQSGIGIPGVNQTQIVIPKNWLFLPNSRYRQFRIYYGTLHQ